MAKSKPFFPSSTAGQFEEEWYLPAGGKPGLHGFRTFMSISTVRSGLWEAVLRQVTMGPWLEKTLPVAWSSGSHRWPKKSGNWRSSWNRRGSTTRDDPGSVYKN